MNRYAVVSAGILLAAGLPTHAQIDTMVVYDVQTMETDILPPPFIPSAPAFDRTEPPSFTFPESGFTDFIPAQQLFDVSDYPMRTAIANMESIRS